MYRKILVPYDDSDPAKHALSNAMDLVDGIPDALITVLNVVDWHDYNAEAFKLTALKNKEDAFDGDPQDVDALMREREMQRVSDAIAGIVNDAANLDIAVLGGSPHDVIVEFASRNGYDCIVMGHRGLGPVRAMLGSVAYSVLQKSEVPVLIVK